MSNDIPAHSRTSGRTLLIAITGFGSAALVTSFSVLAVNSVEAAVRVAVVGGTGVLGISALVVGLCAFFLRMRDDRIPWALAALALILTTAGSALRSSNFVVAWRFVPAGIAEGVYIIGVFMLLAAAVAWPLLHRRGDLGAAFLTALGITAIAATIFWVLAGSDMVAAAYRSGEITPTQMRGFLGVQLAMLTVCVFTLESARRLRDEPRTLPQVLLAAGVFAMMVGDLDWLWRMAGEGWSPGSLGDFTHLAGHVIIAVGASLALDISRSELKGSQAL